MIRQTIGTWKEMGLEIHRLAGLLPTAIMQAVTVSAVTQLGQNLAMCEIEATADGDAASGNIAHGKGFTPDYVLIIPLLPQGALKNWAWTVAGTGAVNIAFACGTAAGSGTAGNQVRMIFGRLHTEVR
jgi:hypothetical protein